MSRLETEVPCGATLFAIYPPPLAKPSGIVAPPTWVVTRFDVTPVRYVARDVTRTLGYKLVVITAYEVSGYKP